MAPPHIVGGLFLPALVGINMAGNPSPLSLA